MEDDMASTVETQCIPEQYVPHADVVCPIEPREEWLSQRQGGIGGSDGPAVVNRGFKSRFELWCQKRGVVPPVDLSHLDWVEAGRRLEPVVAEWFADRTGRELHNFPYLVRSTRAAHMIGTPDRFQVHEGRPGVVEIKTAAGFKHADWKEEPPDHYQIQLQHLLWVTGLEWGTLVCLIGGNKLVWYDMERNDRFLDWYTEECSNFWEEYVKNGREPAIQNSVRSAEALERLYPEEKPGTVIHLPGVAVDLDEDIQVARARKKQAEADLDLALLRMKQIIGDAERGLLPNGIIYEWKTQSRKGYRVQASTFRKLERKEPK